MNAIRALLDTLVRYQSLRTWFIIWAGPALSTWGIGLTAVLIWGGWPKDRHEQIIFYIGTSLIGVLALVAITIIALTRTSVSGKGPGGVEFNVASGKDDDPPPPPSTKTTVITEMKA